MQDDIHMRYLQQYYNEHGSIADVEPNGCEFVVFEGKKLYIAKFLSRMREEHKRYIDPSKRKVVSAQTLTRFNRLEKMNFAWEKPRKKRSQTVLDEKPIKYLKYHYSQNKTINDISFDDIVEFEGEEIKIGSYIRNVCHDHNEFLRGVKKTSSPVHLMRYSFFEDMEFVWDTEKRNAFRIINNDIMIRYLKYRYSLNKTINDIGYDDVVIFEEQELRIGEYLTRVRAKHREFLKDPNRGEGTSLLSQEKYRILEGMKFEWGRQAKTKAILANENEDPYIDFLQEHFEIYGTINNITEQTVVEVNGQKLQIGAFLQRIRARYRKDVQTNFENIPGLRQIRYQVLQAMGFNFTIPETLNIAKIARDNNIDEQFFQRLVKKLNGDYDKALKIISSQERLNQRKEQETCKDLIISQFLQENNIDFKDFFKAINKTAITKSPRDNAQYNDNVTLEEFCLQNKLNFEYISKAIRLKKNLLPEEDFESLINRVIIDAKIQTKRYISSWTHSKYPNVYIIRSLLAANDFSWESVFRNIRVNITTLDEALEDEAFRKNKPNGQFYLEELYHEYVAFYKKTLQTNPEQTELNSQLEAFKMNLIDEYRLTEEETKTITTAFMDYREISHQYRLLDVGFEKDSKKREEKIIAYDFTPDEVEEAFFYPLNFNETELIGRNSELYQRRQLLRNLTSTWTTMSEPEKSQVITENGLTTKEVTYIISTRRVIDSTKEKIYQK